MDTLSTKEENNIKQMIQTSLFNASMLKQHNHVPLKEEGINALASLESAHRGITDGLSLIASGAIEEGTVLLDGALRRTIKHAYFLPHIHSLKLEQACDYIAHYQFKKKSSSHAINTAYVLNKANQDHSNRSYITDIGLMLTDQAVQAKHEKNEELSSSLLTQAFSQYELAHKNDVTARHLYYYSYYNGIGCSPKTDAEKANFFYLQVIDTNVTIKSVSNLLSCATTPTAREQLQKEITLLKREQQNCINSLETLSAQGNTQAQKHCILLYNTGKYIERSNEKLFLHCAYYLQSSFLAGKLPEDYINIQTPLSRLIHESHPVSPILHMYYDLLNMKRTKGQKQLAAYFGSKENNFNPLQAICLKLFFLEKKLDSNAQRIIQNLLPEQKEIVQFTQLNDLITIPLLHKFIIQNESLNPKLTNTLNYLLAHYYYQHKDYKKAYDLLTLYTLHTQDLIPLVMHYSAYYNMSNENNADVINRCITMISCLLPLLEKKDSHRCNEAKKILTPLLKKSHATFFDHCIKTRNYTHAETIIQCLQCLPMLRNEANALLKELKLHIPTSDSFKQLKKSFTQKNNRELQDASYNASLWLNRSREKPQSLIHKNKALSSLMQLLHCANLPNNKKEKTFADYAKLLYERGVLLYEEKQYTAALKDFEQSIKLELKPLERAAGQLYLAIAMLNTYPEEYLVKNREPLTIFTSHENVVDLMECVQRKFKNTLDANAQQYFQQAIDLAENDETLQKHLMNITTPDMLEVLYKKSLHIINLNDTSDTSLEWALSLGKFFLFYHDSLDHGIQCILHAADNNFIDAQWVTQYLPDIKVSPTEKIRYLTEAFIWAQKNAPEKMMPIIAVIEQNCGSTIMSQCTFITYFYSLSIKDHSHKEIYDVFLNNHLTKLYAQKIPKRSKISGQNINSTGSDMLNIPFLNQFLVAFLDKQDNKGVSDAELHTGILVGSLYSHKENKSHLKVSECLLTKALLILTTKGLKHNHPLIIEIENNLCITYLKLTKIEKGNESIVYYKKSLQCINHKSVKNFIKLWQKKDVGILLVPQKEIQSYLKNKIEHSENKEKYRNMLLSFNEELSQELTKTTKLTEIDISTKNPYIGTLIKSAAPTDQEFLKIYYEVVSPYKPGQKIPLVLWEKKLRPLVERSNSHPIAAAFLACCLLEQKNHKINAIEPLLKIAFLRGTTQLEGSEIKAFTTETLLKKITACVHIADNNSQSAVRLKIIKKLCKDNQINIAEFNKYYEREYGYNLANRPGWK